VQASYLGYHFRCKECEINPFSFIGNFTVYYNSIQICCNTHKVKYVCLNWKHLITYILMLSGIMLSITLACMLNHCGFMPHISFMCYAAYEKNVITLAASIVESGNKAMIWCLSHGWLMPQLHSTGCACQEWRPVPRLDEYIVYGVPMWPAYTSSILLIHLYWKKMLCCDNVVLRVLEINVVESTNLHTWVKVQTDIVFLLWPTSIVSIYMT